MVELCKDHYHRDLKGISQSCIFSSCIAISNKLQSSRLTIKLGLISRTKMDLLAGHDSRGCSAGQL